MFKAFDRDKNVRHISKTQASPWDFLFFLNNQTKNWNSERCDWV